MNVPREEIYAALFKVLNDAATGLGFATVSRRLKHIQELEPSAFPAAFQVQSDESAKQANRLPTVWTLNVDWWINVYNNDESEPLTPQLNEALDALCSLLDPETPLELVTLSGRVYNAAVSGTIEVFEGVLGDRALAILPIRIVKAD